MEQLKLFKLFLLMAFLLSSCAPAATITSTSTPTQTFTPAPTATQTPSPTPTIVPTLTPIGGGSGKLIFEYYKVAFEKSFPDLKGEVNIFTSNLDGTDLVPITNGLNGYNYIQSISPDGPMVLVASYAQQSGNDTGDLYLINLNLSDSKPIKLASGASQAIFLDNTRIVYIGQGPENYGFYIINIDGTNPRKIGTPSPKPINIVSSDKTRVYWVSTVNMTFKDNTGYSYAWGDFDALWWTNIDGSGQGKLEFNEDQIIPDNFFQYAFSRDGKDVAWIPQKEEPNCYWRDFVSGRIGEGIYTKYAKAVIDWPYVDDFVHRCFIMYVASLSNIDNPTKVVLMPPTSLLAGDFTFGESYRLNMVARRIKDIAL